jgi:hypothetical protein
MQPRRVFPFVYDHSFAIWLFFMASGVLHETFAAAFFRRSGNGWEWMVAPTARGGSLVIPSGPDDSIVEASSELDALLHDFPDVVDGWSGLSPEAAQGYVDSFKASGRKLTDALFAGRQDEFVAEMKLLESASISQITDASIPQHLIEFCVLSDGGEEFFLGEKYPCIYRVDNRDPETLKKPLPVVLKGNRRIGYAEDDCLDSACEMHNEPRRAEIEEIFLAIALAKAPGTLFVLEPLTEDVGDADVKTFQEWMDDRHHVKHFNSHLEITERVFRQPRLRVRSNAFVGKSEMPPQDVFDLTGSFIFLNACSSGRGLSSFRTSLAWYLQSQNATGVAYTTGPVSDAFATRFARAVYRNLDEGKQTLFKAFHNAKLSLLGEGHPMALLYTFVGPDTYVLP